MVLMLPSEQQPSKNPSAVAAISVGLLLAGRNAGVPLVEVWILSALWRMHFELGCRKDPAQEQGTKYRLC
jgi:hypothetical protein